jgi:hypothetical protein
MDKRTIGDFVVGIALLTLSPLPGLVTNASLSETVVDPDNVSAEESRSQENAPNDTDILFMQEIAFRGIARFGRPQTQGNQSPATAHLAALTLNDEADHRETRSSGATDEAASETADSNLASARLAQ